MYQNEFVLEEDEEGSLFIEGWLHLWMNVGKITHDSKWYPRNIVEEIL